MAEKRRTNKQTDRQIDRKFRIYIRRDLDEFKEQANRLSDGYEGKFDSSIDDKLRLRDRSEEIRFYGRFRSKIGHFYHVESNIS